LGSAAASLFYESDRHPGELTFLATSESVYQYDPLRHIEPKELASIRYRAGEGATGTSFEKNSLLVIDPRTDAERKPRFVETEGGKPLLGRATAFCPIPHLEESRAVGVLRCVGPEVQSPLGAMHESFDRIDLETLLFIAQQIGPVLNTLAARIERERTISIIKHDLIGPISMIRHIAEDMETVISSGSDQIQPLDKSVSESGVRKRTIIPYRRLMNIKAFALEASNLVFQLDPELKNIHNYNPQPTFLEGDIVARLSVVMRFVADKDNQMSIRFDSFAEIPALHVDRGMVERVLYNIIMNAIKYGKPGTEIRVRPRQTFVDYRIDISNEGVGVPPHEKDLIFEESYRSDSTSRKSIGLGLGLFIARRAMERHSGQLVLSSLRDPTIFTMIFPNYLRFRSHK